MPYTAKDWVRLVKIKVAGITCNPGERSELAPARGLGQEARSRRQGRDRNPIAYTWDYS